MNTTLIAVVALVLLSCSASLVLVIRRGAAALAEEKRWADAERAKHMEVENTHHAAIQNARALAQAAIEAERQQRETASIACDAAQAMTHDIARLVDALQDASALLGGKPQDWRRLCPKYRIDDRLFTPGALKDAALHEWERLLAEVQGAAPFDSHPASLQIDIDDEADSALAVDLLDTIGPGVGA